MYIRTSIFCSVQRISMPISCCFCFYLPSVPHTHTHTTYSIHTSSVHYNAIAAFVYKWIVCFFFGQCCCWLNTCMSAFYWLSPWCVFLCVCAYACGYWWLIALNKCCSLSRSRASPSISFHVTLASFPIEPPSPSPPSSLHSCAFVCLYREANVCVCICLCDQLLIPMTMRTSICSQIVFFISPLNYTLNKNHIALEMMWFATHRTTVCLSICTMCAHTHKCLHTIWIKQRASSTITWTVNIFHLYTR